mgnify:CR=1 FL=1
MNYDQILNTVGVSQSSLETIIIFSMIAVVIGYFVVQSWQYIIAGILIVGVLVVFGHHSDTVAKTDEPIHVERSRENFMRDCLQLTEKESMCESLWKERFEE